MVIGILKMEICLPNLHSLKDKRKVLKSLIAKLRKKFNISVAETGGQNKWQRSTISVVLTSNDSGYAHQVLEGVVKEVESSIEGFLVKYEIEII